MHRKAFTIIELMVTIGIIALLAALALPALSGARIRAHELKAMSQLHALGLTLELYLQDAQNPYPYHPAGTPYSYAPAGYPSPGNLTSSDDPWSLSYLWPTTLHRVAPWEQHYQSWLGPNPQSTDSPTPWQSANDNPAYSTYRYANAFIGDPACWLTVGPARARPTRQHETRFPSSKAIMFDLGRNYLPTNQRPKAPRAVLAADSSAALRQDQDATPPVNNRARTLPSIQIYHDTPAGIFGRDF